MRRNSGETQYALFGIVLGGGYKTFAAKRCPFQGSEAAAR